MKRVLVDVDGVLADFVAKYLQLVHEVTGKQFTHEQVTEFDIGKALGLTPEQSGAVARGVLTGFASMLEPLPGAVEGLRRLREISEVYIVTSPWNKCETWMSERERWLRVHFDFPHSHVLHGSAKHLVRGDILIDDKTETWESPWNKRDPWAGVLTNDWDRVCRLVEVLP
jgi:5'(3')-deoxyribonucleotidase